MAAQRWFAGLPVAEERRMDRDDEELLREFAHSIWTEGLISYAVVSVCLACVIAASTVSLTSGWLGPVVLGVTSGALRYVPQRRFFALRVLFGLRKDIVEPMLMICRSDDMTLEVLAHSHVIWRRNGLPLERPMVAHATATAMVPDQAKYAANFVRPHDAHEGILIHQRALSEDELTELDSYAPRPSIAVIVLAVVGLLGAIATFAIAAAGRIPTMLPPFAFAVIGAWAGRSAWRAHRARKRIAADLEAGFVVIVRASEAGELGPPEEVLPYSNTLWTQNGETPEWRKQFRAKA